MSEPAKPPRSLGIVVIGRNEGERLVRCLHSLPPGLPTVYVDSASQDDSVTEARRAGADVVELDRSSRLTAARARNAGFQRLIETYPDVSLVQFVDGDCELDPIWLSHAERALEDRDDVGVLCGRLRERNPEKSIFNRLCDADWSPSFGDVDHCGGIFVIREPVFREAGRFDEALVGGEEPDLCFRIRRSGWRIVRDDVSMGVHDANLLRFSEWWAREARNGFGHLDLAHRYDPGPASPFVAWVRSARVWGIVWPLAVIAALALGGAVAGKPGAAIFAGLVALAWPAQVVRTALRFRREREESSWAFAFAYGLFAMLAKWPQLAGHARHAFGWAKPTS